MKIKLFNPKAKLKVYLCNREKPFYPILKAIICIGISLPRKISDGRGEE